jgi:DAPG hydrolase PhiG domain
VRAESEADVVRAVEAAAEAGMAVRPDRGERVLNNRLTRRVALPGDLPGALAAHCAEEYANLAVLLPELHGRFGPGAA